ncbi:MAG: thioredoxin domain-containing protein [Candidatus Acidiferrales bacterium]
MSLLYGWSSQSTRKARVGFAGRLWLGAVLALGLGLAFAAGAQTTRTASTKSAAGRSKLDSAINAVPNKTIGNSSAPIRMDVYSDYECPSCGNFYENTLKTMIQTYVADGKVYLVHHDFPLQMHRYSGLAARLANAAAKMGKFQDVDAALFDNQAAWTESGDVTKYVAGSMSSSDFARLTTILKGCSNSVPPQSKADGSLPTADPSCPVDKYIVEDIAKGYQIPVRGTPTFVITYKGKPYSPMGSPVTWQVLKQFFDSLLSQ